MLETILGRVAQALCGPTVATQEVASPASSDPVGAQEAWAREKYNADPAMSREYLQAVIDYPHIFRAGDATLSSNVETVVGHFGGDGLTRKAYFKALALDRPLLITKPDHIVRNVESVLERYDADPLMRREYLQAAADQPALFRTPPAQVFAAIAAAADRLESAMAAGTSVGPVAPDGTCGPASALPAPTGDAPGSRVFQATLVPCMAISVSRAV